MNRHAYPYALLAPAIVLVAFIVFYPLGSILYTSTKHYVLSAPGDVHFVGLQNYASLLTDGRFWSSLQISMVWVGGSVVPQFLLGLGLALLLNERFAGRGVIRALVLLPWVVSGVITAIIWSWIFDGTNGVLNDALLRTSIIGRPIPWSIAPASAFFMVLVANTWRGMPFFAITLLAALQAIPSDLYEAATIDGADRWQRFRYVSLPMLLSTIVVTTLLASIWTFNFVDLIWTMTRGGPVGSTNIVAVYIFNTIYHDGNFGYAATLAVALGVIMLAGSMLYFQVIRLVKTV